MKEKSTIWIKTQPDIEGTYRVVLETGEDASIFLDEHAAMAYASEILRAVASAEYDAAVLAQMSRIAQKGEVDEMSAMVVTDLRQERPPLQWSTPLALVPGVSHRTRKAFLTVELNGLAVGQWDLKDAREHAAFVVEAVHAADLDNAFYRLMRKMDVDDPTARSAVGNLAKHR